MICFCFPTQGFYLSLRPASGAFALTNGGVLTPCLAAQAALFCPPRTRFGSRPDVVGVGAGILAGGPAMPLDDAGWDGADSGRDDGRGCCGAGCGAGGRASGAAGGGGMGAAANSLAAQAGGGGGSCARSPNGGGRGSGGAFSSTMRALRVSRPNRVGRSMGFTGGDAVSPFALPQRKGGPFGFDSMQC